MREPPRIAVERLRAALREHFALDAATLEYLPVGADYRAGVYRVVSVRGNAFLLKATARPRYTPAYLVPRKLHEQGSDAVVSPLPARNGALWAEDGEWTVVLYPFLDGETGWSSMTRAHWRETGRIFQRIHQMSIPRQPVHPLAVPAGFASLCQETFDPSGYVRWMRAFAAEHLHAPHGGSPAAQALCAAWLAHLPTIDTVVGSLETLAPALRSRALPCVICHGDLHPGNLLRDPAGRVHVLDWDEVMLAPKERDFIFVRESPAEAFWEGYGPCEIDWAALTYFRWGRVAQDLIADAHDVVVRADLGEGTRAEIARRFSDQFAPGDNVDAARAAAAHLPADLRFAEAAAP